MESIEREGDSALIEEGRFEFGKNWNRYLSRLSEERIEEAERSLQEMLQITDIAGLGFLDVGSGSGLFSLAARRLGARVYSFDFDPQSVKCTSDLKERYFPGDNGWEVSQGSALDKEFMEEVGQFEIVYSWGVLHHTGAMWQGLEKTAGRVAPGGMLFIAIYNDQGWLSSYWSLVKRLYNASIALRYMLIAAYTPYFVGLRWLVRALRGRPSPERGMSLWYDMKDWLGGYPFETAKPEAIVNYFYQKGFSLTKLKTCGGRHGCNEYVFESNKTRVR